MMAFAFRRVIRSRSSSVQLLTHAMGFTWPSASTMLNSAEPTGKHGGARRVRTLLAHQELAVAATTSRSTTTCGEQGVEHNIFYRFPRTRGDSWRASPE